LTAINISNQISDSMYDVFVFYSLDVIIPLWLLIQEVFSSNSGWNQLFFPLSLFCFHQHLEVNTPMITYTRSWDLCPFLVFMNTKQVTITV
jgi:hypothetical protein